MPQLETATYFSQLFWLVICFGAILLFSWRISLPRLSSLLQDRWNQIEGKKDLASALCSEADSIRNDCELELSIARGKAKEIILQTDHDIKLRFEQEKNRLSQETKEKIKSTEQQFLQKIETISEELPHITQELATEIVQKILAGKK